MNVSSCRRWPTTRFRARLCGVLGLIMLWFGAADLAGSLASGSVFHHVLFALAALGFAGRFWQASRCRHGAKATAEASTRRVISPGGHEAWRVLLQRKSLVYARWRTRARTAAPDRPVRAARPARSETGHGAA